MILVLLLIFSLYLFFRAHLKILPKIAWIVATPTSQIRSVALGLVEVNGFVHLDKAITSPATGRECCLTKYRLQELRVHYSRQGRTTSWDTIESGFKHLPFYLRDESGANEILVNPEGVELDLPSETYYLSDGGLFSSEVGSQRCLEWAIYPKNYLYVIGEVKKRPFFADFQSSVDGQLAIMRGDREHLQSYDRNKDGQVDSLEWDGAVREAEEKVREEMTAAGQDHLATLVIGRPSVSRPFLIADRSEKDLLLRLRLRGYSAVFFGVIGVFFNLSGLLFGFVRQPDFAAGYYQMVQSIAFGIIHSN